MTAQLVEKGDGRTDVIDNRNKLIGYVENETLFGIDDEGFAVRVAAIQIKADIIPTLAEWRALQVR